MQRPRWATFLQLLRSAWLLWPRFSARDLAAIALVFISTLTLSFALGFWSVSPGSQSILELSIHTILGLGYLGIAVIVWREKSGARDIQNSVASTITLGFSVVLGGLLGANALLLAVGLPAGFLVDRWEGFRWVEGTSIVLFSLGVLLSLWMKARVRSLSVGFLTRILSWLALGASLAITVIAGGTGTFNSASQPPTQFVVGGFHEANWEEASVWLPPTLTYDMVSGREFIVFGVESFESAKFTVVLNGERVEDDKGVEIRDVSSGCNPNPELDLIDLQLSTWESSTTYSCEIELSQTRTTVPELEYVFPHNPIVLEVVSESGAPVVVATETTGPGITKAQTTVSYSASHDISELDVEALGITNESKLVLDGSASTSGRFEEREGSGIKPGVAFLVGDDLELNSASSSTDGHVLNGEMALFYGADTPDRAWTKGVHVSDRSKRQRFASLVTAASIVLGSSVTLTLMPRRVWQSRKSRANGSAL